MPEPATELQIVLSESDFACIVGAIWFGRLLPAMRIEARRLIVAQGMAGGEPAQELNAQAVEE